MATPMPPPALMQSGPPAQPPELPTLSAMQGQSAAPPQPGQVGSLPELFFNIEQQIKLVAKAVPVEAVAELDRISQSLRAVLVKVLQSGAALSPDVSTLGAAGEGRPSISSPAGPSRPDIA